MAGRMPLWGGQNGAMALASLAALHPPDNRSSQLSRGCKETDGEQKVISSLQRS